jgi:hypothetical protein
MLLHIKQITPVQQGIIPTFELGKVEKFGQLIAIVTKSKRL